MAVKKGAKKKQKKRPSKLKAEEQAPELPAIEETPPRTVPGWVTTFADLMSLLMVFFVMLVSVSTIEKTTFEKMVKSMKSELGGGQTKDDVEPVEVTDSVETVEEVGEATEKVVEELKQELKVEIKKKILEVEGGKDAVTIQLLQNATFRPGSVKLKPGFKRIAKALIKQIKNADGVVAVVGHTDNVPFRSKLYRSNWELAASRSVSVVEALTASKQIDRERFYVRSYGATQPRVPNTSRANRAKNRRISIIIRQDPIPKALGSDGEFLVINKKNFDSISEDKLLEFLQTEEDETESTP